MDLVTLPSQYYSSLVGSALTPVSTSALTWCVEPHTSAASPDDLTLCEMSPVNAAICPESWSTCPELRAASKAKRLSPCVRVVMRYHFNCLLRWLWLKWHGRCLSLSEPQVPITRCPVFFSAHPKDPTVPGILPASWKIHCQLAWCSQLH